MKNGGVAILGNAEASGENRAHKAIEEALNSPLLNDNDIRGAKWILININSAEGPNEFTMDEVEVIQSYLLSQAGEGTDVILGMGYDNSLDDRLGITLIATGFEHKDPFAKPVPKREEPKTEAKIVMTLRSEVAAPATVETIAKPAPVVESAPVVVQAPVAQPDLLAPKLVDPTAVADTPMPTICDMIELDEVKEAEPIIHYRLEPEEKILSNITATDHSNNTVDKKLSIEKTESINSGVQLIADGTPPIPPQIKEKDAELILSIKDSTSTT